MRYITDYKRVIGGGAAHTGTEHHWAMHVSSIALAFLLPIWIYIFGSALGSSQADVLATFERPFPAIVTALTLIVGMRHFAKGAQTLFEDYSRGTLRHLLVFGASALSYLVMATGLFALVRIAI